MAAAALSPPPAPELAEYYEQLVERREERARLGQHPRLTIMVRTYVPRVDQGLVLASWCRQIRRLPPFGRMSGREFDAHHRRLERLLERCPPTIACEPEHPDQVFGWICGEVHPDGARVLHFVYVRNTWRQQGIARYLLELQFASRAGEHDLLCTHRGRSTPHLETKWRLRYDPGRLEQEAQ